ncbi:MAG: cysteine desulfurase family protein [Planctomycetota bacterium]
MTDRVYLDNNATTPLDPRVFEAMRPYFLDVFGNAASRHVAGQEAFEAVERAREVIAGALNADPREIVFTSGATESDNLALKGVAASSVHRQRGDHIVSVRTEHRAVMDPLERLEREGSEVTWLGVDARGVVDLGELSAALRDDTVLVSIMHANNETGVLQPIRAIGELCRSRGVLFHTDATQSFGKEPIDVEADRIDLLSLSAHKLYGPKGVGALYVRRKRPRVRLEPIQDGGGHERGFRSGTLNVPGIVGLAEAARLATSERDTEQARVRALRDRFEGELGKRLSGVTINGLEAPRLSGTSNVSFEGVVAEQILERLPSLCASTSSACTSATRQPSYVLAAMGSSTEHIRGSVRFSLGRFTTEAEIERAVGQIAAAVSSLRLEASVPEAGSCPFDEA